jgi:arabinan endo-1,5-alpha-L-arabinosidase
MKLSDIYMRDPYVYVEDGVCYLIGTSDIQAWGGKASGFLGYKSRDLLNFEGPFILFENTPSFWADENFWAPELHKIGDRYCLFASFYKSGLHRASQVLFSDAPFGKYKPSDKPFTPKDWDCLDATYYEEDGRHCALFVHEWTEVGDGEICLGELGRDFASLNNLRTLFRASSAPWVRLHEEKGHTGYVSDGPFIYKGKQGTLFMLWSSFGESGYALGVARSHNGVNGPWMQENEPLVSKGGHGMIFSFGGELYLIIHTNNDDHPNERPCLMKIGENEDGLFLKGE